MLSQGTKTFASSAHELVVAEGRDAGAEAAPQLFRDRDLHDAAVLAGVDPAALPELAAPERFEEQGLAAPAAVNEEAGGLADADGRLLGARGRAAA